MANKWKVVFTPGHRVGGIDELDCLSVLGEFDKGYLRWDLDRTSHDEKEAEQLAAGLNELETLREEKRWRCVGVEWPEPYMQDCLLWGELNGQCHRLARAFVRVDKTKYFMFSDGTLPSCSYTHWRPAPTDVPVAVKEGEC